MAARVRAAIIGRGRLGRACEQVAADFPELELAGTVQRGGHVRDLGAVEVALVCVPTAATREVAAALLQQRVAIVECAALDGHALEAHHAELARLAARHRSRAVLGAGWDPGVLTILRRTFELLVPHGTTELTRRPVVRLHHTIADAVPGVRAALATEQRASAQPQRYVYVELEPGARLDAVQSSIAADPAFSGEATQVFAVESVAALEAEAHGVLLERRGSAAHGTHSSLLLEGRFDPVQLAARAMLDAARYALRMKSGGHRYHLAA
jgi:diaminopimelate dehydrogenase